MHVEALHDFYCLPNIRISGSMMMGWTRHEAVTWERRNAYIALAAKRDGNMLT
jgi:hypothetical protein